MSKQPGPFEAVWRIVSRILRGRVATYGQISQMLERRLTPLGVGWAIRAAGDAAHRKRVGRGRDHDGSEGEVIRD